jgi:Asp/Glu/hydantoin racemase
LLQTVYHYFTPSFGPSNVNELEDCKEMFVMAELQASGYLAADWHEQQETCQACLIASFRKHPLITLIDHHLCKIAEKVDKKSDIPVLGLFEASVSTAMQLLSTRGFEEKLGIFSTVVDWEEYLTEAVHDMIGSEDRQLAGVEALIDAGSELWSMNTDHVEEAVTKAFRRLKHSAEKVYHLTYVTLVIILAFVGLPWVERDVRRVIGSACRVVDSVGAGVGTLQALLRVERN